MLAEIERARDMGVIGAGEAGWKGTAEVPAPTVKEQAAAVKPEVLESGMHQPVEAVSGLLDRALSLCLLMLLLLLWLKRPIAGPAESAGPPIDASHPIARDVARKPGARWQAG
jgi:hypothetical protein